MGKPAERLGPHAHEDGKGDAAVSVGVYATALWMIKRHSSLGGLADPKEDLAALEVEVRQANDRYKPRESSRG